MNIEPNSPLRARYGCGTAVTGRGWHSPHEMLARHRHAQAFAAIVLSGTYVEAGDSGRHQVGPGNVIFHDPYESHLDRFGATRVEVLSLPFYRKGDWPIVAAVKDPDAIARLAERDMREAAAALSDAVVELPATAKDWPDLLAAELLRNPDINLARWSADAGLHPGSVSRGFRQQFGITPAQFRSIARTRRAVRHIADLSLSHLAIASGFADQAHMSRAVKRLTGLSPGRLREQVIEAG